MLQSEQVPIQRSRISVDSNTLDKFGLPKLILDWQLGDAEVESMRKFTLRCKEALEEAGIAELHLVKELEESNPAFVDSIRDNYHHVGGLCMADSETEGVVDTDLLVFGTKNLYVLGASTFRTTSNANSTFLAYTFATRLAEHLHSPHLS
jgi:choline dehydrogenase-like flavoprotein